MKENALLRTNILVCAIIVVGFIITSVVSYKTNIGVFEQDVEHVSTLAADGIQTRIETLFVKPVNTSLTLANDILLKQLLLEEDEHLEDAAYAQRIREYLHAYRSKYAYDSVFLVSAKTGRYYHFNGIHRVLLPGDPENVWYFEFLKQREEYSLNVDNDEAASDSITVFVNCRITDRDGTTLGVVGVGFRVRSLQGMLSEYNQRFGVQAQLVDKDGLVEISSEATGHEGVNLFSREPYASLGKGILGADRTFWYGSGSGNGYMVTRYIPNLKWHLLVANDTTTIRDKFGAQMAQGVLIILLVIGLVLLAITRVFKKCNEEIVRLTVSQELEYQRLLQNATERLYDTVFEVDITRNRLGSEATLQYFSRLGCRADASYDEILRHIVEQRVKEEYRQGYLDIFRANHVFEAYENGVTHLSYDFLHSMDGNQYRWVRASAQIFFWHSDQSVRMIVCHQSIDAEKRRELLLLEAVQRDSMTGLYNKQATEQLIAAELEASDGGCALLIFDIDHFKKINDAYGHAFGDTVISAFAAELRAFFSGEDIVGRIGGDEFVALMRFHGDKTVLEDKLNDFLARLRRRRFGPEGLRLSSSIGVALYPTQGVAYAELCGKADQALYVSKMRGRGVFTLFEEKDGPLCGQAGVPHKE